jgi:hypothetical protein
LRWEGVVVGRPYPTFSFETRITHLGDTRLVRFG